MIVHGRDIVDGGPLDCDICIAGAGPAGITLACELEASGLSIILLEAGDSRFSPAAQAGLEGEVAPGNPHTPPTMYRRRVLGGASSIWGGRCVPLDPIDLEPRDYVGLSGWPISWDVLRACYDRAQPYFDAGAFDYEVAGALGPGAPPTISGFDDPDILTDQIERFSPPTDFGKRYAGQLHSARNIRVVTGAEALRVTTQGAAVTAVEAAVGDQRLTVRARRFVLAMGGLEIPRLLMNSDATARGGLGNEGGALGRYYMCHLENTLGRLQLIPPKRPITLHFERSLDGAYVRRKFILSAAAQRREGLLNTAFRLHYPPIADPSHGSGVLSAVYLAKDSVLPEYRRKLATIEIANRDRLRRDARFWAAHGMNVVLRAPDVAWFGIDWIRRRTLARRKLPFVVIRSRDGGYPLDFNAEQIPNPDSRVRLGDTVDRHGLRRLLVDWRAAAQDFDSLLGSLRVARDSFARSGVARLDFDEAQIADIISGSTPVGGHHIGAARMAVDPRDGVVDANCAVHGFQNLYCAGAAVFPTSGHANPTLTIVALAIRLADHLKADARRDGAAQTRLTQGASL
jgi:choline dehydrogenase-like flavoprotein